MTASKAIARTCELPDTRSAAEIRANARLPGYPADMATLEELERRVEQLEGQVRHQFPAKIDAVAYGVSLVPADTQAIRETLAEHGQAFDSHGEMLQEILRRLPTGPGEAG
jgi:hypothetical protein